MGIRLKVTGGPHLGKEFQFDQHDSFIVGRGRQAHFQLAHDDRYFSRVHFMVEINPPLCRLVDLGSRNGTKVNGQRVTTIDLKDGDVIAAGKTVIQVSMAADATESPAADAEFNTIGPTLLYQSNTATANERLNAETALDAEGLELLPAEAPSELPPEIPDPHGHLPPDYRQRVQTAPQPIRGYHLVRELGRGGMGTVHLAIRDADRSIVAVKTILPGTVVNRRDQERFLREAQILRQLIHPNIVSYRDNGECDGRIYFAMEYVPGRSALDVVQEADGKLPIRRAVRITLQLLTALRYAHAEGFVHRDIKPSNLLVTASGAEDVVKLTDFGLARAYQASGLSGLTMTGDIGGTIGYMAPEQITDFRGAQPATDQYAAAATLYYLLTRKFVHDFPQDTGKRLMMILDQQPVPIVDRRPGIPEGLAKAIHRALAHDPKARFPDVRGFFVAIEPFSRFSKT